MLGILSMDKEIIGEACGIFAGSGSLYPTARSCVLEVRGNRKELYYYTRHVKPVFEKIFLKNLRIIKRSYKKGYVIGIRICGREAMKIFHTYLEFPTGGRSNGVKVPKIIWNNAEYWKAYIRGVFDTDGSVYLRKTGKKYRNPVVEISSRSLPHLQQLKEMARDLGFNFWLEKNNRKIRMAGWKNTERFFKEINPHNNAKQEKFKKIMSLG